MTRRPSSYTAIVLAGERGTHHPLPERFGACCKAVLKIGDRSMLEHVTAALLSSRWIDGLVISGPEESKLRASSTLQNILDSTGASWSAPGPGPSKSAFSAMQSVDPVRPVLLTTADHPLLTAAMVDTFCEQAQTRGLDAAVALAPYPRVHAAYPEMKKTVLRLGDGGYCGCNLFAFLTPAGRDIAVFWQQVEQQRKHPLRLMHMLGWSTVIRYALGRLSLEQALNRLSSLTGLRLGAVVLHEADAAIDVDSIEDYQIVSGRFSTSGLQPAPESRR